MRLGAGLSLPPSRDEAISNDQENPVIVREIIMEDRLDGLAQFLFALVVTWHHDHDAIPEHVHCEGARAPRHL